MQKTLTIKNPWAYLICSGIKDVENRSRKTNYRGKILIHCSKQMDSRWPNPINLFTTEQIATIPSEKLSGIIHASELDMSAIIGEVEIVDCIQNSKSVWAESGQWHWVLKNAVMYPHPILSIKGKLGIWNYDHNPSNTPLGYFKIESK